MEQTLAPVASPPKLALLLPGIALRKPTWTKPL
jgi:hypothetical protein